MLGEKGRGMNKFLCMGVLFAALLGFTPQAFAGGGGEKKEELTGTQYVELDPLLLPIIDDSGITQQVSLIVKLEIEDPAQLADVTAKTPKIVDAFVSDLYGALSQTAATMENGVLRLDRIKSRLRNTANKVMGENKINDVLLQVVQQHRV